MRRQHSPNYSIRKRLLCLLNCAVDGFLKEGNKLIPIAENYSSFTAAQKERFQKIIEPIFAWDVVMLQRGKSPFSVVPKDQESPSDMTKD